MKIFSENFVENFMEFCTIKLPRFDKYMHSKLEIRNFLVIETCKRKFRNKNFRCKSVLKILKIL